MRNLLTLALVLLGCSAALAQPVAPRSPRGAAATMGARVPTPSSGGILATMPVPGLGAPGTLTPTTGVPGAISPLTGTAATIGPAPIGAIAPCAATPGFSLSASTALITGGLPTPPLPGLTLPPAPSFGSSLATGSCNPMTATRDAVEALGIVGVVAPTPGLAAITTPSYGDPTVPLGMTEAGGSGGLGPLIDVPMLTPCGITAMTTSPTITPIVEPSTDPAMATSMSMTMSMSPSVMTTSSSALTAIPPNPPATPTTVMTAPVLTTTSGSLTTGSAAALTASTSPGC